MTLPRSNIETRVGAGLLLAALICGVFAGQLAPHDPWAPSGTPYEGPTGAHLLGTNDIGQDILSEILFGIRVSLLVGLAAAGLATFIGTCVGLAAGYFRGAVDEALMAVTETLMLVPGLPLMIVLVAYVGSSYWTMIAVIGLIWWTTTARAVRAKVMQVREMPYIEAARALGTPHFRILFRHALPNAMSVVLARFAISVPDAILTEAGLSFLGLGDPTMKSLGSMLNQAFTRGGLLNGLWWWYSFPVAAIAVVVLGVTLVSMGVEAGALKGRRD